MKIKKLILRNMLIAAGLSMAISCKETPVAKSPQTKLAKPAVISVEPIKLHPSECCYDCGRG